METEIENILNWAFNKGKEAAEMQSELDQAHAHLREMTKKKASAEMLVDGLRDELGEALSKRKK